MGKLHDIWRVCLVGAAVATTALAACSLIPAPPPTVSTTAPTASTITSVVHSPDMIWAVSFWEKEVARLYDDAVLVFAHGADAEGLWFCEHRFLGLMPVETLIQETKLDYPGRHLVLIVCNPSHRRLDVENVTYSLDNVWLRPDRSYLLHVIDNPEAIGNIFEFQEN